MRTLCTVVVALLAVGAVSAAAQSGSGAEVALNYTYVHSNAPPGGCGCFSWNGGSASAAWHVNSSFAGVADFGAVHAGNYDSSGFSPTMVSYLFGPRYTYQARQGKLTPYAQVLLGVAHATNGYFPIGAGISSSASAFALTAGGGLDITVAEHVAVRAGQVEYFYTSFPNGVNRFQSNLRVSAGVVFRFGSR
jgi:outer membrane immunogenic protein